MITNYQRQWDFLKSKFGKNQLAHAYLFSGKDIESVNNFAKEFTKFVNCLSPHHPALAGLVVAGLSRRSPQAKPDHMPCNKCQNCKMIESGSFPDLMVIKSIDSDSSVKNEKDMMEIEVKQIREAQNFLSYKSYYGNFKTVIVQDAERMTFEAQNCFLKTLEEPKGQTLIFLISSKPDLILTTILSRCQEIKFFYTGKYEILKEEESILNDFKSVMNYQLAEKFQYAKKANLEGENFSKILSVLRKYFRQQLLSKITDNNISEAGNSVEKLKKIIKLIENISHQSDTANINRKLALEIALMEI